MFLRRRCLFDPHADAYDCRFDSSNNVGKAEWCRHTYRIYLGRRGLKANQQVGCCEPCDNSQSDQR